MATLSDVNLQKQTVAQLIALFREHKLSGYSKLKKAALIEKLETHRDRFKNVPVSNVVPINVQPNAIDVEEGASNPVHEAVIATSIMVDNVEVGRPESIPATAKASAPLENTKDNKAPLENASTLLDVAHSDKFLRSFHHSSSATPLLSSVLHTPPSSMKRLLSPLKTIVPEKRKRSVGRLPETFGRAPKKRPLNPVTANSLKKASFTTLKSQAIPKRSARIVGSAPFAAPQPPPQGLVLTSKRRFVPLKRNSIPSKPVNYPVPPASQPPAAFFQSYVVQKEYDAPLSNITIPPSLSQRKCVKGLALVLRDLQNTDRRACSLASRTLRYAVYVSAQFILSEEFPGRRTEVLLARAHDCFSNIWPYLTFRRQEKARSKEMFQASFLARYAPNPMSERIWGNPDGGDEVSMALRFTLSRLWFTVSLLGDSGRHFLNESIWDLKRLQGDEIWKVTILTQEQMFYVLLVLGLTGEPIGCQHQKHGPSGLVRADWGQHIGAITNNAKLSIWDNLRCANEEEFGRGISKSWMQIVEQEGDTGALKCRVGERYVMASLVANSVSGAPMSHLQMAMQTVGIPLDGTNHARKGDQVNLYLSEHHHVESVHFASSSGKPFHPLVASVQTPHREYFILRENGLQIGSEEDGVSETWVEILGVLRDGSPCSR